MERPTGRRALSHGYVHTDATNAIADSADSADGYDVLTLRDDDSKVLTVEYKTNLPAPASGDLLEAFGTALDSGRRPTACRLEVHVTQPEEPASSSPTGSGHRSARQAHRTST